MQRFLYLVALFSIPLVEATEVKRASTAAPDTTLKTLRRRQASGDTSSLAGALTGTFLSIPGLSTDSVTVTTITQPPLTTVTTLPVYFCSKAEEVNCTATVSGKAMAFNAEIQWPAQITAESGFMFPPPWATQVLSVGCDGSVYQIYHLSDSQGPKSCPFTPNAGSPSPLPGPGPGTGNVVSTSNGIPSASAAGGNSTSNLLNTATISTSPVDGLPRSPSPVARSPSPIAGSLSPPSSSNPSTGSPIASTGSSAHGPYTNTSTSNPTPGGISSNSDGGMVEIGSTTYTAQPIGSFVIVGSNTITQGAPPVTIASTAISLGTNRVLIGGSSSLTIDSPTHLLAPQPSVSPPASLSSPISVAWATSVVTSGGLSASYVETQFSNLATITAPTLVPTHITISGSAGQTSVVSITESVNTGGFYFSPIPVIGPGGSPSLPQIPGPRGPPDSPSCWKLGVISVGNCGEGSKNNNNNKKSSEDTHSSTESSSSATSASSDQSSSRTSSSSSSCSSTTLTDYSIIYDASVSSYSTHSYTTLASCGVSPATTTVSATASCSGECSIGQFTFASVHADSYSNVGEAAITSAEQYILGVLSTASWGVNATVTAPNLTSSASPTTTADPICAVHQDPNGGNGGPQTCAPDTYCDCTSGTVTGQYSTMTTGSNACAWSTIPSQTWDGSSCSGPTTAAPTHTGQYLYTETMLPVSGPDSVVIACTSMHTTFNGIVTATYCQDSTPVSTITPVQTTPTGSPATPSCNTPGNPQDESNWDKTNGYVPHMEYFKAAIGFFCGTNCQGQEGCLTAAGVTLDGQTTEFKSTFPCTTVQQNNSALNCEPPYWEASGILFNIGLKLIGSDCTWTVDQNTCYSDLSNSLTGCPAGALDWNECIAWTVGAGAASLKLSDWQAIKVPSN